MKWSKGIFTLIFITLIGISFGYSQDSIKTPKLARNSFNLYIGSYEYNINYERNFRQKSRSNTNIRLGLGYGEYLSTDEGFYINPALVHLIGKNKSHLEINLGFKYLLNNKDDSMSLYYDYDPKYNFLGDFFLGYRYEKPEGGFLFRIGVNYPAIFSIGIGIKF